MPLEAVKTLAPLLQFAKAFIAPVGKMSDDLSIIAYYKYLSSIYKVLKNKGGSCKNASRFCAIAVY